MAKLNECFHGRVRDIATDGSGVVEHPDGQVFFVPGVWRDEEGEFRITGFKKRFGFARLEQLTKYSPSRVDPPCPHQGFGPGQCGGCPWQFVDYQAQLEVKQQRVERAMARLGCGEAVKKIWGSPAIYGYRNRAQFKTDGRSIGYVAQGSNTLVAIDQCPILTAKNSETLIGLLQRLPEKTWRPSKQSRWTTLDIDEDVTAEAIAPNQRRPFRQANDAQNQRMKNWLAEAVDPLDKSMSVIELFAGAGNFSEVLSDAGFEAILAVEGVAETVEQLRNRQLPGVNSWLCNLFSDGAYQALARQCPDASLLVLDPPRDGLKNANQLLEALPGINRILYISCDLATFGRDISAFIDGGFRVEDVQPLDQFPHTPHIELLAKLVKDK
jgi:23S rRNA (uracil1939-C5)-methyltransferase